LPSFDRDAAGYDAIGERRQSFDPLPRESFDAFGSIHVAERDIERGSVHRHARM
jgi:hypothetical protein